MLGWCSAFHSPSAVYEHRQTSAFLISTVLMSARRSMKLLRDHTVCNVSMKPRLPKVHNAALSVLSLQPLQRLHLIKRVRVSHDDHWESWLIQGCPFPVLDACPAASPPSPCLHSNLRLVGKRQSRVFERQQLTMRVNNGAVAKWIPPLQKKKKKNRCSRRKGKNKIK